MQHPGKGSTHCGQSRVDSPVWGWRALPFSLGQGDTQGWAGHGMTEAPRGATSRAQAGGREAVKGSRRVSVSENSRNGATRRLGTSRAISPRRKPRLGVIGGHRGPVTGSLCWKPIALAPWLASLTTGFLCLPVRPSLCPADLFPSSPAIPLSLSTLVAETISQCPAKGVILIGCDLSNKTLAGRASQVQRAGNSRAWLQSSTSISLPS